jgi:hypothetical protein
MFVKTRAHDEASFARLVQEEVPLDAPIRALFGDDR